MGYRIDIGNIAYSPEYIDYRNDIISSAYRPENKGSEEAGQMQADWFRNNGMKMVVEEYCENEKRHYCAHTKMYKNDIMLHEYFNVYHQGFFCEYIAYSNGQDYIFYKEDLYGYSVFEVSGKRVFNYFPASTFKDREETFIGTDIHYNAGNNIFAVGGCYWACPCGIFLVKIDNPLEQFTGLLDMHEMLGYDKYGDFDFIAWENNDLILKAQGREGEETITVTEKEYMKNMIWIK